MGAKLSPKAKEILLFALRKKRMKESLEAIALLNAEGVEFAVLKGPALSARMHSRDFGDLDILVGRGSVRKACSILVSRLGYEFEHPEELELFEGGNDSVHDISLVSRDRIPVEVHFRMFNYLDDGPLDPLSERTFVETGGVEIPCQSPELQLLEAVFHNVYHHFFICDRGKWVRDVNFTASGGVDWERFGQMLERTNQRAIADLALRLLAGSKGERLALPDEALLAIRPRSALEYLHKETYFWALRFAWDRLFPPAHLLARRFGTDKRSPFFLLSYPRNWLRLLFKVAGVLFPSDQA